MTNVTNVFEDHDASRLSPNEECDNWSYALWDSPNLTFLINSTINMFIQSILQLSQ